MGAEALSSIFFSIVAIGFITAFGLVAYTIFQNVTQTTRKKMEKRNVAFSREGMRIGVKEVSSERIGDKGRSALVNTWNHASFPASTNRRRNVAESPDTTGVKKA